MERSNENVIEFLNSEENALLTLSKQKYINRVKRLKESHPNEVHVYENADGTIFARVPVRWIKINPTKAVSEEQRRRSRENIMKMWESKRTED